LITVCGIAALGASWLRAEEPATPAAPGDPEKAVAHDLYFSLKDGSPEGRAKLIAEARRCLAPHPGIVYFSTGVLTDDMKGLFVDRNFDVVIHMVFENRQALKTYARTDLHNEFVAKQSASFKSVRIFDAEVERYDPPVATALPTR
jgi:hypothetical protein